MTSYDVWNLVTLQICKIAVPNFVSRYRCHGYICTYNFRPQKKHSESAIFYIVNYEPCRSYGAIN